MNFPFGETISVTRRTRNSDGDWEDAESFTVPNVGIAPTGGTVNYGNQRTETSEFLTLYLPASAPEIPVGAEVTVRGGVWKYAGENSNFVNPFTGWHPGRVATLQRNKG